MTVGPDPAPYVEKIEELVEVGYTHVYVHQIGQDQDGFFRFWNDELRPRLAEVG